MIETIPGLLRAAAKRWPDKTALESLSEAPVSFARIDAEADRFARALIADGMRHGERFGVWAPNMWEWVAAAAGAQRVGATLVPLNPRLRAAEIADIINRGRVTRLVAMSDGEGRPYASLLHGEDMPGLRRVILLRSQGPAGAASEVLLESFLQLGESIDDAQLREREAQVTGDTLADILFTSGTTGRPKGAVFTHRRSVLSSYGMVNFARVGENDCMCPLGPFAHLAGYKAGWVNGFLTGAKICWSDAADPVTILDVISKLGVTVMPAPPIVWQDVLNHPSRADWDTSSLRFVATGSTVIPPELIRRLVAEMALEQVGTGYGLTESGGMTNFARPGDSVENVAVTAGRTAPDSEVCIAAEDGKRLGPGETGEILIRNERMLLEYLDDPAATHAAIDGDGWLRTGDVGSIDAAGYLRVTDRLKDMYITNGFNVYPAEVERLIGAIEGVDQCAVIGVPEPRKGEVGHLFLVRAPGSTIAEDEVIAWCKRNIASYKIPAGITFVDALPRNSLGKVLKRELAATI